MVCGAVAGAATIHENPFTAGAPVIPGPPVVNLTLTIMATAQKIAAAIA
jgi:hypothetical protein